MVHLRWAQSDDVEPMEWIAPIITGVLDIVVYCVHGDTWMWELITHSGDAVYTSSGRFVAPNSATRDAARWLHDNLRVVIGDCRGRVMA